MEAPPITAGTFLDHYRKSGLIDDAGLAALPPELFKLSDAEIAQRLIADGRVTRWQADKLLAGKYKGFRLGKYQLLGLIGKGGMSAVYLGQHTVMRRRSAIKVLPSSRVNDASYLGRFHREAEAIASLNHNNIVRAYDVDVEHTRNQEIHFLAMEYVEGPPLSEVIDDHGLLTFAEAIEVVRQTCEGLDHAHEAGLVHRDIKPSNLLVDKGGVVKILDLGLARFFDDQSESGSLTVAHDERVLGTADYLAPEQAVDSHTVDERADIYSLGCTVYYLLTGAPPFTDQSLAKRLLAHQTRSPELLAARRPDTPDSVEELVARMMEKRPDDRFSSARELADACRAWLDDHHGHAPVSLKGLNDAEQRDRPEISLNQLTATPGVGDAAGRSALSSRIQPKEKLDTAFLKALNDSDIGIVADDDEAKKSSPDDTAGAGQKTTIDGAGGEPAAAKAAPKSSPAVAKGAAPGSAVAKAPQKAKPEQFSVPSAVVKAPPPARRRRAGEQEEVKVEKKGGRSSMIILIAASVLFIIVGVVVVLTAINADADAPTIIGPAPGAE